jgi:hypothetical protein
MNMPPQKEVEVSLISNWLRELQPMHEECMRRVVKQNKLRGP